MSLGLDVGRWPRRKAYAVVGAVAGAGVPLCTLAAAAFAGRNGKTRRRMGALSLAGAAVSGVVGRVIGRQKDGQLQYRQKLDELRDEYEAVVAHDFRDPIAGIVAQSSMLLRKADGAEVTVPVAALRRVEQLAWRLDRLVSDLLDASRIERGRLALDVRPVLLQEAVPALLRRLAGIVGEREVKIHARGAPRPVLADAARLDQVLTNLIENAVKFSSPATPVEIAISQTPEGAAVAVIDHGAGVAPADVAKLFDRNYQVRRTREHKSGLGMGLYLTKGLVEGLGGRLEVRSAVGEGSTFSVMLPGADPALASVRPSGGRGAAREARRERALKAGRTGQGFNAVVTIKGKTFAGAVDALRAIGPVRRTNYYNVVLMQVDRPDRLPDTIEERAARDPRLAAVATVVPIEQVFKFQTPESFEAEARRVIEEYVPKLAGKSFHVRVHRRGMKGRVSSHVVERALGEYVMGRLESAGTPGRISFRDPDAIVDIETVGTRGGVSFRTREQLQQHPLLGLD